MASIFNIQELGAGLLAYIKESGVTDSLFEASMRELLEQNVKIGVSPYPVLGLVLDGKEAYIKSVVALEVAVEHTFEKASNKYFIVVLNPNNKVQPVRVFYVLTGEPPTSTDPVINSTCKGQA